jgi:hypothetical protein
MLLSPAPEIWGSPLASELSFKTPEEAHATAREYLAEQRSVGKGVPPLRVVIEEARPDGSIVKHSLD